MVRLNLLIDLSGTLHIGDSPCQGAVAALSKLHKASTASSSRNAINLRFCSNTTKESTKDLHHRLIRAGFSSAAVPSHSIQTSLEACRRMCSAQSWRPLLLLTPSAQALFSGESSSEEHSSPQKGNEEIRGAFYPSPTRPPSSLSQEELMQLMSCDTVIIGLAPDLFTSAWMDAAFRILSGEFPTLQNSQRRNLVATHRALCYRPAPDDALSLGPGAYVAALESACRREPKDTIVCGKPSAAFFKSCLEELPSSEKQEEGKEERNIIIGDDIDADLGDGAIELGLERVLVKTGKYREGDEKRSPVPVTVFDSFAHFVDQALEAKGLLG